MAVRPPQIRYLTAGKALGAALHKGFAATWNWVLSCVNFLKAGKGLKLTGTGSGHPRLDVLIESGDGIDVTCAGDGKPYVISRSGDDEGGEGSGDGGGYIPEITAEHFSDGWHILVDSKHIATIPDGHTPQIIAQRDDKTVTIYVDGVKLCEIEDGKDGDENAKPLGVVTGVTFEIKDGKLVANLTRKTVIAVYESAADQTVEVCDVEELKVVTGEAYDTGTHKFTNTRKTIKVLGAISADGQMPFIATEHSAE